MRCHAREQIQLHQYQQNKAEKVNLVITDNPAFQILNEAMKGMKHVVIYLTTYSFLGHQQFTNYCN